MFFATYVKSLGFYSIAIHDTGWLIIGFYGGLGAKYLSKIYE